MCCLLNVLISVSHFISVRCFQVNAIFRVIFSFIFFNLLLVMCLRLLDQLALFPMLALHLPLFNYWLRFVICTSRHLPKLVSFLLKLLKHEIPFSICLWVNQLVLISRNLFFDKARIESDSFIMFLNIHPLELSQTHLLFLFKFHFLNQFLPIHDTHLQHLESVFYQIKFNLFIHYGIWVKTR